MKKSIIIYQSFHHHNTKKIVDEIKKNFDVEVLDVDPSNNLDLNNYDYIGFASGIAYGKFYQNILDYAMNNLPENKKVFLIYTCGVNSKKRYTREILKIIENKKSKAIGIFGCLGYDTYGILKYFGGIAKKHPNQEDISKAIEFYRDLIQNK